MKCIFNESLIHLAFARMAPGWVGDGGGETERMLLGNWCERKREGERDRETNDFPPISQLIKLEIKPKVHWRADFFNKHD